MSAGVKTASKQGLGGSLPPQRYKPPTGLQPEDKLLILFIGASALLHAVIMTWDWSRTRRAPIKLEDEMSIAADLVTDFDMPKAPTESALPRAKQAEEARVSDTMLPQLPKRFEIKEAPRPAEEEPVVAAETKPEPVAEAKKPPEEPPPPPPKAEPSKPQEAVAAVPPKPQEEEANKLSAEEVQKRSAMERLKALGMTAKKQNEAPKSDPAAALAQALASKGRLNAGNSKGTGTSRLNNYATKLKAAIQPNYNVPEVYRMRASDLVVSVLISVNDQGQLNELSIEKSSGVPEFDEITLNAIRASAPLPKPPQALSGEQIIVNFNP